MYLCFSTVSRAAISTVMTPIRTRTIRSGWTTDTPRIRSTGRPGIANSQQMGLCGRVATARTSIALQVAVRSSRIASP
uniref:Uncharacterized protein n=1 Tax=Phlebotomus papatasi TaxID=29031 RepID=A0A1B0DDG5_PHLPP